ncbi:hypothetical protein COL922a_005203 [Colletotrichum nupharicola]|nr:hypothetical protein COL922a_005203 [Colletotrichum nupharicola]
MVSRHRVDRDELAAHIEANNRAANLLRASFNDPSIRTFSSGFTGGPSAPPQTAQPRWLDNMCFTRFSAQSDPPPPPQQQQQTTGYRAAPRRESVSAPRHDFHDRDCGDRPRRDALPDVWYDDFWHDPSSAHRHSGFLETAMEADGQRTISGKRKMTGTPVAANKKQKMSPENGTSAFQAARVSEGADGALDSESTADGAVGTDGGAQDAGLDEENVQTPAEPTPTLGSSKTFLEATVDEAMDQGKYMTTVDCIWPKTRDWAADGDEIETYADAVSQIAVSKWAKLTVMKVKLKLDANRRATYNEMSKKDEKQFSCAYTDWWTTLRLHERLVTESEFQALRDSGFIKTLKKEQQGVPPFDERFRDHLQNVRAAGGAMGPLQNVAMGPLQNMKTAGAVQPAPPALKPVQDARVEDQRRRLSELALHCLRDHVMPGDMTSYMTDLADHAASLLNLRNKDDMRLSASDVDAVISDQWRVYNGDGKVVENAKAASSWYWSRKQEKQTQQKQQTQQQQQTPNVVHTSWLPPELAAPNVASAFSLPSRTRPPHGVPHSRR